MHIRQAIKTVKQTGVDRSFSYVALKRRQPIEQICDQGLFESPNFNKGESRECSQNHSQKAALQPLHHPKKEHEAMQRAAYSHAIVTPTDGTLPQGQGMKILIPTHCRNKCLLSCQTFPLVYSLFGMTIQFSERGPRWLCSDWALQILIRFERIILIYTQLRCNSEKCLFFFPFGYITTKYSPIQNHAKRDVLQHFPLKKE